MRPVVVAVAVLVGILATAGIVWAVGGGTNDTNRTVSASHWADDACGTIGAWQGDLKDISVELRDSTYAGSPNDGGSGDQVEELVDVPSAVDRAISSVEQTLQPGLKRAGKPNVGQGSRASQILVQWAQQTRSSFLTTRQLVDNPPSAASRYSSLGLALDTLHAAAVNGHVAFAQVAQLDPTLTAAIDGSKECQKLKQQALP